MTVITEHHTEQEAMQIAQIGRWFGPAGQDGYAVDEFDRTGSIAGDLDQPGYPSGRAEEAGPDGKRTLIERRVFQALLLVAVVSLLFAVLANYLWAPFQWGGGMVRVRVPGRASDVPPPRITPVDQLPAAIAGYETITRHAVPGQGGRSVEALYVTMNMNLDVQVPIAVYARVEGLASDVGAKQEAAEIMRPYPLWATNVPVGKTGVGRAGYSPDQGTYCVAWSRGPYAFWVKATFRDKIPAQKRDFLRSQARPVVDGIGAYLAGGKKGFKF